MKKERNEMSATERLNNVSKLLRLTMHKGDRYMLLVASGDGNEIICDWPVDKEVFQHMVTAVMYSAFEQGVPVEYITDDRMTDAENRARRIISRKAYEATENIKDATLQKVTFDTLTRYSYLAIRLVIEELWKDRDGDIPAKNVK